MSQANSTLIASFALACLLPQHLQGQELAAVKVNISGVLSSDPADVLLIGDPGPFTMPHLLGGSFAGHFTYRTDVIGAGEIVRNFPVSNDVYVEVRDGNANLVYTIVSSPSPFKVARNAGGDVSFPIGVSPFDGGPSDTPTRLAFRLVGAGIHPDNMYPPTSEQLNAATQFVAAPNVDFMISLFSSNNPFDKWLIPFELTVSASTIAVPEPCSIAIVLAGICLVATRRR